VSKSINHFFLRLPSNLPVLFIVSLLAVYSADSISETKLEANNTLSSNGKTLHTVPYITLRNKTGSDDASEYFGGERGTMRAGYCGLSTISLSSFKAVTDNIPFYIPEDIVSLDAVREIDTGEFWKDLKRSSNGRFLTLYTHGFNIDFEKGCKRASLFQKSVGLKGSFLLFSWPSNGELLNYTHDEANLYWSVEPLHQMLTDMVSHYGAGNINITAHSLGTRGILLALVLMSQAEQDIKPIINQVVLIAPDIDAGVFKQYLPLIKSSVKNITIYVSDNDSPLLLSQQVHGYPRLGQPGAHLDGLTGVEVIDISDFPVRSPTGHIYHLYQGAVIDDLDQLLNQGKLASQRHGLKQTGENYWRLLSSPEKN